MFLTALYVYVEAASTRSRSLMTRLMLAILLLAAEKQQANFIAPIGIGLALFVAELLGVYYTGGSLNPARSFGPAVVIHTFASYRKYLPFHISDSKTDVYQIGSTGSVLLWEHPSLLAFTNSSRFCSTRPSSERVTPTRKIFLEKATKRRISIPQAAPFKTAHPSPVVETATGKFLDLVWVIYTLPVKAPR